MAERLKNKVALITGAGQGIGRAIALRLSEEGAKVAISDISDVSLRDTLAIIESKGGIAMTLPCDVSNSAAVGKIFSELDDAWGGIDVLVNNAGIGSAPGDGQDHFQQLMGARSAQLAAGEKATVYADHIPFMEDQGWQKVVNVNLNGTFYCCREAVRLMIERECSGSIINISSTSAFSGEGGVHYCASKAAVVGLTRSLAMELAPRSIRVNVICPGPTDTSIMKSISEEWRQAIIQGIPLGRIGSPAEIANTALFLASDEASAFTGQTLMANLGTYLQ